MSDYDVIVIGGGSQGEHCAGRWRRAACGSRSSSGSWSAASVPTGRAFPRSRCSARARRCTPRTTPQRPQRSTSRLRRRGVTSWSRTTPTPARSAGSPTTESTCFAGAAAWRESALWTSTAFGTRPSTWSWPRAPIRSCRPDSLPRAPRGDAPGASHGGDVDEKGNGLLREGRLYQLVREPGEVRDRTLEITLLEPGAEAYAFTFG